MTTRMRDLIRIVEGADDRNGMDDSDMDDDAIYPSKEVILKDGRMMVVHAFSDTDEDCISVYATVDDTPVADGKFDPDRSYFRKIDVAPEFRRLGVATAIYDYIIDQGFSIRPSNNVQPDGQRFWAARQASGK